MLAVSAPARTVRAFRFANLPIRVRLIRWPIPNASGRNEAEWDAGQAQVGPRVVVSGRNGGARRNPYRPDAIGVGIGVVTRVMWLPRM